MNNSVRYERYDAGIAITVEKIEGFGKNPGLWIGTKEPNQLVKVASFGNEKKAELFVRWLDCLIGHTDEVKWE